MFGNLINNRQLRALIGAKDVLIEPFDEAFLKATHYTLHPGSILKYQENGTWKQAQSFSDDPSPFEIKGGEYVVVEVQEFIQIAADGLVGRFIQPSNFVESGLSLIAGQIDSKYGIKGERLRCGIKNNLSTSFFIKAETRLAHVEFFDLRGIANDPTILSKDESDRWSNRMKKARDDGVDYGDGS